MKKFALAAFAVVPLLSGCATHDASTGAAPAQSKVAFLTPGAPADFAFVVENVGGDSGLLLLNSKEHYRDPQCITVALKPAVAKELKARYGDNLEAAFLGKKVHVRGKVELLDATYPDARLLITPIYRRTQIMLKNADQIEVI
jgi:hypothetical protein